MASYWGSNPKVARTTNVGTWYFRALDQSKPGLSLNKHADPNQVTVDGHQKTHKYFTGMEGNNKQRSFTKSKLIVLSTALNIFSWKLNFVWKKKTLLYFVIHCKEAGSHVPP